jgi:tripartite-type tricarboxylate transporter receptor subunit TctC
MTVMFGAGSAADVTARYLADGIAKLLGVPVPVVNRTGGGGAIGYSYVSKQKPDGHSIIWNSNSISSTYHSGVLPFDYTAFDPVARVSLETPAIAVRADAPWKSLRELIAHAQSNPGKVATFRACPPLASRAVFGLPPSYSAEPLRACSTHPKP